MSDVDYGDALNPLGLLLCDPRRLFGLLVSSDLRYTGERNSMGIVNCPQACEHETQECISWH